jgi:hypothetical protein
MKKKGILFLLTCFFASFSFAQQITIKYIESRLVTHQGIEFVGTLKDKNNDLYIFDNWNNKSEIFVDNKRYFLSNLNFNVTSNAFVSRIKRDELFYYKMAEIDAVKINNQLFKKVGNYFYEVLLEKDDTLLLKKYDIKYKVGTVSRLDGTQGKTTRSITYKYLLKSNDAMKMIELNKKSITSLLETNQDQDKLNVYVKSESLTYKKEDDTIKIVGYIIDNFENNIN